MKSIWWWRSISYYHLRKPWIFKLMSFLYLTNTSSISWRSKQMLCNPIKIKLCCCPDLRQFRCDAFQVHTRHLLPVSSCTIMTITTSVTAFPMRRVFRFITRYTNFYRKWVWDALPFFLTVACVKNNAPIRQTDDSFSRSLFKSAKRELQTDRHTYCKLCQIFACQFPFWEILADCAIFTG